jgi:cob(I)alamin adenosyltransferase
MAKQTILYTRQGDEGYTTLLGPGRVPKYDLRPEAYGTVDEATSFMGLARAEPSASERTRQLMVAAQRDLWVLMAELAASPEAKLPKRLAEERTRWLEAETDRLGTEIPPLTEFVLPGNTMASAWLDVARAVVRRAERSAARLLHEGYIENREIVRYLNRLSSLLFALARYEEALARSTTVLAKDMS